jgi:hypothetical protein
MDAITIPVVVGEDRRLVIDLPADVPVGPAELVIKPRKAESEPSGEIINPAREAARAKLLAAGKLVTGIRAPEGTVSITSEERLRKGQLLAKGRSTLEMINEDRGDY